MTTINTERESSLAARLELTLVAKQALADGITELLLRSPTALPEWKPGAHIDLVLDNGTIRSYSLCGDPGDRYHYRVAVLREPESRGGSAYVHDELSVGDVVPVDGPRNHFGLLESPEYQFIAGGIGITPIIAMVRAVESTGGSWNLLYGGRRLESMAYLDELRSFGERVRVQPEDTDGRLDLDTLLLPPRENTLVYACGPEPLLAAVEERCAGWPEGSLRTERFAAATEAIRKDDQPFEVVFARSGVTRAVPPGESILDVASEAGVFILRNCSEGVCGTCETLVLEGEPDHRDSVLTDQDRDEGAFMPCVSRCASERLVIDL